MNFFLKKNKKNKKNLCGAVPRTPQRDPQNLCLQGKWMPLTLRLAAESKTVLGKAQVLADSVFDHSQGLLLPSFP